MSTSAIPGTRWHRIAKQRMVLTIIVEVLLMTASQLALGMSATPEEMAEARDAVPRFQEGGVPVFPTMERAVRALKNALDFHRWRQSL